MAEKTLISSSQESLPLSEETCQMLLEDLGESFNTLMFDATLNQVGTDLNPQEDLKEKKTLEEKSGEVFRALTEEVKKTSYLSKLNSEMNDTILDLSGKLENEIKGRLQLEQAKLFIELSFREQLKEKEALIDELKQQLEKYEEELNRARMICYEEAAAKEQALKKLKEIEYNSYNINDLSCERTMQAPVQKQELQFNEDEDLYAYGTFQPMDQLENSFSNTEFSANYLNTVSKTQSSLPATEVWPGEYSFRVSFATPENSKAQWVYSASKNKLFVKKDAPCPINFSTIRSVDGFNIRTTAYYSSADHILDPVHRCVNHSMAEIQSKKPEAEHLVRVESCNALYESDPITRRHSVVLPFDNPAAGQQFSSYIFKFACFQSCSGGPNRRPLMLCFTLERRGVIVGRQKVHLKICACPQRDFKIDEKSLLSTSESQTKTSVKRKKEETNDTPRNNVPERNYDMPVKVRPGPFYLKVEDRRNYEVLKFIAKICLAPNNQPLDRTNLINLIRYNYSSSSEDDRK